MKRNRDLGPGFRAFYLGSAACLCLASILVEHASIRSHPFFAAHHYWPPMLALLLVVLCVCTLVRFLQLGGARGLSKFALALLELLFVPALCLSSMVAILNLKSAARMPDGESARVEVDAATGVLRIRGRIFLQSVADVTWALQQPTPIQRVDISSLGGAVTAARKIGQLLRERDLLVRIAGVCASACVDIWALSAQRQMTAAAFVGLHQPHSGDLTQGGLLHGVSLQSKRKESVRLLVDAGFPRDVVETALSEPSRKVSWFSASQLVSLGVRVTVVGGE